MMQNRSDGSGRRKNFCSHSVYIKGLCGNCGIKLDPPQSTSVSMIHSVPELKVSEEYAKQIGQDDQQRLIEERKLVLLVDLDQTILHTTHEEVRHNSNVHSFKLWPSHPTYYTKLRPHLTKFLEEISKIYELHIFTFGCRMYAHKIASIIDPDKRYFGNRILSRDESVDQYSKKGNLNNLFPCGDAMVCIIDDRADVWRDAANLIQVKPYSYFKTSISDGALMKTHSIEDEESLERDADKLSALLGLENEIEEEEDEEAQEGEEEEQEGLEDEGQEGGDDEEGEEKYSDVDTNEDDTNEPNNQREKDQNSQQSGEEKQTCPGIKEFDERNHNQKEQKNRKDDGNEEDEKTEQADISGQVESNTGASNDDEKDRHEKIVNEKTDSDSDAEPNETDKKRQKKKEESRVPSPMIKDDLDDQLLYLPRILNRIHEKWYMELDEQRQFLVDGESYKLPDIKDIIKRYLRKKY